MSFIRERDNFVCDSLQKMVNSENDGYFEQDNASLIDNISYEIDKFEDVDEVLDGYDFSILIQDIFQILSPRDREILFKRIGYQLDDAMGLHQIGEEYHLT